MIEISKVEFIAMAIELVCYGVWSTLFWVDLRHKINTNIARWICIGVMWLVFGFELIFG